MRRCPPTNGRERRRHGPVGLRGRLTRTALPLLLAFAAASASFAAPAAAQTTHRTAHATTADGPVGDTPAGSGQSRRSGRQQPVTLAKTGTDLATGSTTRTAHGDTVRWVVSATNPDGAPVSTTVTDKIQGGPGSTPQTQSYVPGSLQVPPGFNKQWSTDGGATFSGTDQGAATNAVQATNPMLASPATGQVVQIPPPFTPINTATGGDGFTPILYTATINGVPTPEIWNIYHHGFSNTASVVCTDQLTNGPCPTPSGAPATWPQALNSSVAGATTGDLGSTRTPTYVLLGSKLYYAAISRTTLGVIGVGCIDLQAQSSCGFTALQTGTGLVVGGVVQAPNQLIHAVSGTGEILCYDPVANASCGTFGIGLPPNEGQVAFSGDYAGIMRVIDGKIYVTDNTPAPLPTVMSCFDPSTNAACTGWATPKTVVTPVGGAPARADNVFEMYDPAGTVTGVCTAVGGVYQEVNPPVGTVVCFDLTGNPVAAPPGLQTLLSTNVAPGEANFQVPLTITAPNGHLETEFPLWIYQGTTPTLNSTEYCYDWNTQAPCTQYGTNGVVNGPPNVNGGNTSPYGFAYDGQCKYSLGDTGYLFSIDPVTGASPCLKTKAQGTINPSAYYCDGATGHIRSYGTVSLLGIDPTTVDFAHSSVTVLAADGTTIGTFPFDPATGTADISSVPTGDSPIQVIANLTLINGSSFTPDNHPRMQVTFVGDAPQICFETTVATDCSVTAVSNQASAVTNGQPPVTSNTVTLQVTPGAQCTPMLTIDKEVCTSTNPADCGQNGPGPWAKTASVAQGATAYWRITVTNTGTVNITGITLTDPVTPSCATTAGSFDLAAGATQHFSCNLPGITRTTTNAVTATFPGPGGTPVTTPPSEATVSVSGTGVPSLSVDKEVCQSDNAADCGAGGAGPWGKEATLHKGNAPEELCAPDKCQAFWRITVTNTGTVDLTGITLNDSQEPACVVAAGTFDLAAGQTRTFYCHSLISEDTVNTVTASYIPPGSPAGTAPVTTPPSSALARCEPPCEKDKCHHPKPGHGSHDGKPWTGNPYLQPDIGAWPSTLPYLTTDPSMTDLDWLLPILVEAGGAMR
ncbi:DUF7617 domain-containing protein [Kitasatospora sp. NPDC054795]